MSTMRIAPLTWLALLVIAPVGCDDGPEQPSAKATQPTRGEERRMKGGEDDRRDPLSRSQARRGASGPVRWKPSGGGGGGGAAPEPKGKLSGVQAPDLTEEQVRKVAGAIAQGGSGGGTYCEKAYDGLREVSEAYREEAPSAERRRPPKSSFMVVCRAMPEQAQRCLVPDWFSSHREQCERIREKMGKQLGGLPMGEAEAEPQ